MKQHLVLWEEIKLMLLHGGGKQRYFLSNSILNNYKVKKTSL